jgi:hypothetical protein
MKKQLYTISIVLGSCLASTATQAQCTCGDGTTPDSVVHNFTLAPTSNFNSTITFPQFNPTVGTLTCVNLIANVTAVANLSIRNLDSVQRDYQFLYTQAVSFSGPGGLSAFANKGIFYGPTTLEAYGTGVDSVHYGPDTPFNNYGLSKTVSNVAPYLGTGNVSINYTNTGSTLLLQGSNNYQSTVSTFAWGNFKLTYYWCAASLLPTGMRNFYATRNEQQVLLQWTTENEIAGTRYEVQASFDGHGFKTIAGKQERHQQSAATASYAFTFDPGNNFLGKIFFRVKQFKQSGQIGYTNIKAIDFSNTTKEVVTITPNPAIRDLAIGFNGPRSGRVEVSLVNAIGQKVYSKSYLLVAQSNLQLHLNLSAQAGMYYLMVKNVETNEVLTQKILLR